jgi:hypothetical protein
MNALAFIFFGGIRNIMNVNLRKNVWAIHIMTAQIFFVEGFPRRDVLINERLF